MITFGLGLVAGLALGSSVVTLVGSEHFKTVFNKKPVTALSSSDHEQLTAEFTTHANAMAEQVSQFADVIAGDDPLLRERLRRFEKGSH